MQHTGIVLSLTQIISYLVILCIGVIIGSWGMYISMRKRDDRLWDAIQHPGRRIPQQQPPTEIIEAVVTDAPHRYYTPAPGPSTLDDTLANMASMGFPGTKHPEEYAQQAAAMAGEPASGTVAADAPGPADVTIADTSSFSVDAVLAKLGYPSREQCLVFSAGQDE